tara:strand:- start:1581 stop:2273 length:693 start_codon:yes stop_codon:yes gene_type:complete
VKPNSIAPGFVPPLYENVLLRVHFYLGLVLFQVFVVLTVVLIILWLIYWILKKTPVLNWFSLHCKIFPFPELAKAGIFGLFDKIFEKISSPSTSFTEYTNVLGGFAKEQLISHFESNNPEIAKVLRELPDPDKDDMVKADCGGNKKKRKKDDMEEKIRKAQENSTYKKVDELINQKTAQCISRRNIPITPDMSFIDVEKTKYQNYVGKIQCYGDALQYQLQNQMTTFESG